MGLLWPLVSALKNSVPGGGNSTGQNLESLGRRKRLACNLSWIQSEDFKLLAPLRGRIAKSLDPETAWQATFDRCRDKIWREERERDRHVDLAHAAFLMSRDLLNVGYRARHDLIKPTTASCDRVDQSCPSLDPGRTNFIWSYTVRDKDLPGLPGRRLLPWN